MAEERLQKLMAQANIASRRACEEIILEGRVMVNGKTATLGDKADPEKDTIMVDGSRLRLENRKLHYYVINKPKNMLSTMHAEYNDDREIVRNLIPGDEHLFAIGRLDAYSEGMIILTNDGAMAEKLTHPRHEHTKTYKVTVVGHPTAEDLEKWERGVWLDDSRTAPAYIRVLERTPKMTTLRIVMIEGRKRQIRRVAQLLGYPVYRLVRTQIGQLGLGTLRKGEWYELSPEEVAAMQMPADEVKYLRRKRRIIRVRTNETFKARETRGVIKKRRVVSTGTIPRDNWSRQRAEQREREEAEGSSTPKPTSRPEKPRSKAHSKPPAPKHGSSSKKRPSPRERTRAPRRKSGR
jgi:pseudouridine synthase